MTSITPPPTFPARPTSPDHSLTNRDHGTGPAPNFAAILAQARDGSAVEFDPTIARVPLHELKSAIAHVFNAFGFFPAASDQSGPTAVAGKGPAAPASDAHQPSLPDGQAGSDPAQRIDATKSESNAGRAAPVHADQHAQIRSAVRANLALGKEPRARPVPFGRVADLHRAEPSRDRHGLEASRSSARPGPEKRDAIHFKIGDCAVELTARLHNLSDEEEDRLIAELQAVLEEHGLSLASATINGMPFATGLLGRND